MDNARLRSVVIAIALVVIPLVCGAIFLADNAPRDWSLHWVSPTPLLVTGPNAPFAAASTSTGWDVVTVNPSGGMRLSSVRANGTRARPDIQLAGAPQSLTLGAAGGSDVALWRQDFNGGSALRAAVVGASGTPQYRTILSGSAALEHPQAFSDGKAVDVVFSWQRPVFNVFLSHITASGASTPVRLTHVPGYAFEPRAVVAPGGRIDLLYFDECCNQQAFYLELATYRSNGQLVGAPRRLDRVTSIVQTNPGGGTGSVPNNWGSDLEIQGNTLWAAWSSDAGITVARLPQGGPMQTSEIHGPAPAKLALSLRGAQRSLVWTEPSTPNQFLGTVQLGPDTTPIGNVDRVAYEAAFDDSPTPSKLGGNAAILWQATSATNSSEIEVSHFTPHTITAPSLAARLGLGLANPVGNLFLLLAGGIALGALITVANILLIFVAILAYIIAARRLPAPVRLYVFLAALAVALYLLLVTFGAPSPPLLAFTAFTPITGAICVAGMAVFVALLARLVLNRFEELYRFGAVAFLAFYFLAFLQALLVVQGQLGRV